MIRAPATKPSIMKKHIFALAAFTGLTFLWFFPVVFRLGSACPAFSSSDELLAAIWSYWHLKYSLVHHASFFFTDFLAYPFGIKIFELFSFVYLGLVYLLSFVFNYIAVYNVQVLLNFVLTGFFTYLLAYRLTASRMAGLVSGMIFAFCPQHFIRSWQHITLSYFQWMPLYILTLFNLKDAPSLKNTAWVVLALFLTVSFETQYAYFMFVATVVFMLFYYFYRTGDSKRKKIRFTMYLAAAGAISLILIGVQFYAYLVKLIFRSANAASAHNAYLRPFEDLFPQSARSLSYFLPSTEHPLFGHFTKNFIGTSFYGISLTEHNLYLGIIALILVFVGWRFYRRNKDTCAVIKSEGFAVNFFLALAVVAWLFSQPPWWNVCRLKIYMPSFFMYKLMPMFRAYCRFGILLVLAVSILAGFGVKYLIVGLSSPRPKRAVFGLLCLLVIFDFWNNPLTHVMDLSKCPKVYDWLKSQEGNIIIAEYPMDADGPNDFHKFYQTRHEKKIVNGTNPGTYAHKVAQEIKDLSRPDTAGILKWMGVKYVLVHQGEFQDTGIILEQNEFERISANPGLKLIRKFPAQECPDKDIMCIQKTGPIDVYEVIAAPIQPQVKE